MTRVFITTALIGTVAAALIWRIAVLTTADRAFLLRWSAQYFERTEIIPSRRGSILDRNGRPLAWSVAGTKVEFVFSNCGPMPPVSQNLRALRRALGPSYHIADIPLDSINVPYYRLLARAVALSPEELRVRAHDDLSCLTLTRTWARVDLAPPESAPFLGSVNSRGVGLSGLEKSAQTLLYARDGRRRIVRSRTGHILRALPQSYLAPREGQDITTSVDLGLQKSVTEVLMAEDRRRGWKHGWAVIYRPRDGDVLAFSGFRLPTSESQELFDGKLRARFFDSTWWMLARAQIAPDAIRPATQTWLTGKPMARIVARTPGNISNHVIRSYCAAVELPAARSLALPPQQSCQRNDWSIDTWTGLALLGAVLGDGSSVAPHILKRAEPSDWRTDKYVAMGVARYLRERITKGRSRFMGLDIPGYEAFATAIRYYGTTDCGQCVGMMGYVRVAGTSLIVLVGATSADVRVPPKPDALAALVGAVEYEAIQYEEDVSREATFRSESEGRGASWVSGAAGAAR